LDNKYPKNANNANESNCQVCVRGSLVSDSAQSVVKIKRALGGGGRIYTLNLRKSVINDFLRFLDDWMKSEVMQREHRDIHSILNIWTYFGNMTKIVILYFIGIPIPLQ